MSVKKEITHMGETQDGRSLYLRKNKTGQWCALRLNRKGYFWDMIDYKFEFPTKVWEVSQVLLEDDLFIKGEVLKHKNNTS